MIIEYIRYQITDEQCSAFEQAYTRAQEVLRHSTHCLRYELARCQEDPTSYILRIEWDSLQGHLQGFRQSVEFQTFFETVRPFFNAIQEMRHYEVTSIIGK